MKIDKKVAVVTIVTSASEKKWPKSIFFELRSQLADAGKRPDWIRESLCEREIDGRRLIGYRLTGHGRILDLWSCAKVHRGGKIKWTVLCPCGREDENV